MELFLKATELENFDTLQIDKLKKYIPIEKSDILSIDDLLSMIQELYYECERLTEKYEDYKQYVEDNYKQRSPYDLYGISERDFH